MNGTYSSMQVDPYFLEWVDILKGPSSVLYGRSSPGGLVALTSKKPLYEPYHQVQATVGCSGLMKPDTHLGENARQIEVSDDQATSFIFR
jgi:outer membrane receptor protein involved in Fe transport